MKSVKTLVFAALLAFSIAFNTFAGEVEVPGSPAPPPPQPMVSCEDPLVTCSTDTLNTGVDTSEPSDYYLFYEALAALLSVY